MANSTSLGLWVSLVPGSCFTATACVCSTAAVHVLKRSNRDGGKSQISARGNMSQTVARRLVVSTPRRSEKHPYD